ncbi:hypothetical protein [Streptomyces sp. NPDC020571]|uniref:hypothetical protein n=1 Tax=Streptomyces sp. NPDC020571 TaxID=3365079 RepID=UPI0037B59CEE
MPEISLTVAGSSATRVYDLLPTARFVHLDLAPGPTPTAGPERDARVTTALVTGYDDHPTCAERPRSSSVPTVTSPGPPAPPTRPPAAPSG